MSPRRRACSIGVAALLLLVLLVPPVKRALEATMTAQMLLLMPLLVVAGVVLCAALPARAVRLSATWDCRGISGLVLASVTSAFWLVPRLLDSAVSQPAVDAARYVSIPLLIGVPFSISWPRASFIVRGVFLLECIATLFRMGWLYLIWPDRLCNSYLLDDQQRLGQDLVLIGVAACVAVGAKLLCGHFDALAEARPASSQH